MTVPWLDDDGDNEHYLVDDEGDNNSPFPDPGEMSGYNDPDGDGAPNFFEVPPGPNGVPPGTENDPTKDAVPLPSGFGEDAAVTQAFMEHYVPGLTEALGPGGASSDPDFWTGADDINGDGTISPAEFTEHAAGKINAELAQIDGSSDPEVVQQTREYLKKISDLLYANRQNLYGGSVGANFHHLQKNSRNWGGDPAGTSPGGLGASPVHSHSAAPAGHVPGTNSTASALSTPTNSPFAPHPDGAMGFLPAFRFFNGLVNFLMTAWATGHEHTRRETDAQAGDPVRTANGEYWYTKTDLSIRGRGLDLNVVRTYQSREIRSGLFGNNWSGGLLEAYMTLWPEGPDGRRIVDVSWGDGRRSLYAQANVTNPHEWSWVGVSGAFGTIRTYPQVYRDEAIEEEISPTVPAFRNGFILREPDGTEYYFCPPSIVPGARQGTVGLLRKVADIHGNAISIRRDQWGHPVEVEDTLGRTIVLAYDDEANPGCITSIADWTGRTWLYNYDQDFGDLLRVDYPETPYLNSNNQVVVGRPFEGYTYSQVTSTEPNPIGGIVSDAFSSHNLETVTRNASQPDIEITYSLAPGPDFDRVLAVTVGGQSTSYSYEYFDPSALPATHAVSVRFPDGELERFVHAGGALIRHEVFNGRYSLQNSLIAGTSEPGGVTSWTTSFEYNDDGLLVARESAPTGSAAVLREEYDYDAINASRFAHGNLIEVRAFPRPGDPYGTVARTTHYTYDPLTASPTSVQYSDGANVAVIFDHQEYNYTAVQAMPRVLGWGILPSTPTLPAAWGLGDLNQSNTIGTSFAPIRFLGRAADVASASGPGGATTPNYRPTTTWINDSHGQTISETDEVGTRTLLGYSAGYLSSITEDADGLGYQLTLAYDDLGRICNVKAGDGGDHHYAYDARDNMVLATSMDSTPPAKPTIVNAGVWREFYFDANGRFAGRRAPYIGNGAFSAPLGAAALAYRITYDAADHPVSTTRYVRSGSGSILSSGIWTTEYDGQGRVSRWVNPFGLESVFAYTPRGLQLEITASDPYDNSTTTQLFEYDVYGHLERQYRPGAGTAVFRSYEWDGLDQLRRAVNELGVATEYSIGASGLIDEIELKNAQGAVLHEVLLQYDGRGRIVQRSQYPRHLEGSGAVTPLPSQARHEAFGHGKRTGELYWSTVGIGAELLVHRNEYDAVGRINGTWIGAGEVLGAEYEFDASNRITLHRERRDDAARVGPDSPSDITTSYTYDEYGNRVLATEPGGDVSQFEYNAAGQVTRVQTAEGRVTSNTYDSLGRLTRVQQQGPTGPSRLFQYSYRIDGALTGITDANGATTQLGYDGYGRLRQRAFPGGGEESFTFTAAGDLEQVTKVDGETITCAYAGDGLLSSITATGSDSAVAQTFEYDALGRVRGATDARGSTTVEVEREYSSFGDLLLDRTITANATKAFELSYDSVGRLAGVTHPGGLHVAHSFDARSRVVDISTSAHGILTHFSELYGPRHRRATLASGLVEQCEFDDDGRQRSRLLAQPGHAPLLGEARTYSLDGNLLQRTNLATGRLDTFEYDQFSRLKAWHAGAQAAGAARDVSYQWNARDGLELLTDTAFGTTDPQSNALNQLLSALPEITTATYTSNGEEDSRILAGGNSVDWQWDALGRPLTATLRQSNGTVVEQWTWGHDAFGRLVSQGTLSSVVNRWHWGEELGQVDLPNNVTQNYIAGTESARPIARTGLVGGTPEYLHYDAQGSVVGLTSGVSLVESVEYDPFGIPRVAPSTPELAASATTLIDLYLGRPYVHGVGASLLGARVFDARNAQFLSRDPIRELGGHNLYAYPGQNPFRWSDRDGLQGQENRALPEEHAESAKPATVDSEQDIAYQQATSVETFLETLLGKGFRALPKAELLRLLKAAHAQQLKYIFGKKLTEDAGEEGLTAGEIKNREDAVRRGLTALEREIGKAGGLGAEVGAAGARAFAEVSWSAVLMEDDALTIGGYIPIVDAAAEARRAYKDGASLGKALMLGGAILLVEVATAGFGDDVLRAARAADEAAEGGYKSFRALKKALGPPGKGKGWHHIVEQSQVPQFGSAAIQNAKNVVAIPNNVHVEISSYYSSIQFFTGGLTVRTWLRNKSFEEQRDFGLMILWKCWVR